MRIMDRIKSALSIRNDNLARYYCKDCGGFIESSGAECALHQDCDCIPKHRCPPRANEWTCPTCGSHAWVAGGVFGMDYRDELRRDHTCPPSATFMKDATWAGPSGR